MNDEELQRWVEEISLTWFHRPFRHKASFNSRLRSTGGRYFPRSHNIEISLKQWQIYGREEVEKIIKHELCHYHLHLMNKGYRHRDADFKQLLQKVGGTRYCRAVCQPKKQPYRYVLICVRCRTEYYRKRKINTKKYVCGKCRGKLQIIPLDFPKKS